MQTLRSALVVTLFAIAFGFVESSVVVYLRQAYYPNGFSFPLAPGVIQPLLVEVVREFCTIVMLGAVAYLAGRNRWQRFAYFMIAFAVWDILYYVWLKVILDWPATIFEWDVLFLIPIPWIGPVIAPVLVSFAMLAGAVLILRKEQRGEAFHGTRTGWITGVLGSVLILASFLLDPAASLHFQYPQPYHYELLIAGLLLYGVTMLTSQSRRGQRTQ